MRIAFYVSGHGYGHATRDCQIIKALLDEDVTTTVLIRSRASPHIFQEIVGARVEHSYKEIDPAVVQPVAYAVDAQKTTEHLDDFIRNLDSIVEAEKTWLTSNHIDLVLSDAPFMPCYAAGLLRLPNVLVTNFTFAEVYSYFPDPSGNLRPLVEKVISCYQFADVWLRMPGYMPNPGFENVSLPSSKWIEDNTGFHKSVLAAMDRRGMGSTEQVVPAVSRSNPHFQRRIIDTPLSVRLATPSIHQDAQRRTEYLESIGLPKAEHHKPILAVVFGGHPIFAKDQGEKDTSRLLPPGWVAIMCGMAPEDPARSRLPIDFYAAPQNIHVPDLLVCASVVLGKLGYGTVSEAISTSTSMIYVPRTAFIEEFGLKRMIETFPGYGRRVIRGKEIPPNLVSLSATDFENGDWRTAIENASDVMALQGLGLAEPGSPVEDGGPQYVGSAAKVDGGEFIAGQVRQIYEDYHGSRAH